MLTHGAEDDVLAAADQPYKLSSLMGILQFGNAGLVGKPKILLIQACRGNKYDLGRVQLDSCPSRSTILPTHADTLLIYSSVKGKLLSTVKTRSQFIVPLVFRSHRSVTS